MDSFVIIEMLNRERVILIEQIQLIHFILTLCKVLISFMVDNIQCFLFFLSLRLRSLNVNPNYGIEIGPGHGITQVQGLSQVQLLEL